MKLRQLSILMPDSGTEQIARDVTARRSADPGPALRTRQQVWGRLTQASTTGASDSSDSIHARKCGHSARILSIPTALAAIVPSSTFR